MPTGDTFRIPLQRTDFQRLLLLIGALVVARLLFIFFMPPVYSTDLHSWLRVMDILEAGGNPYKETDVLNWPPFWMQIVYGLKQISKVTGWSPTHLIQATLITGEALSVSAIYLLGRRFFDPHILFRALLVGISLNPVCIWLSCQHCNYDVFVGLFVVTGVLCVAAWQTSGNREAWLAACFFIGMGILAKTVPFLLTPLLLIEFRKLPLTTKTFGMLLTAAPVVIGMSVLYTLAPLGVRDHVFGYRSLAGWYGVSGLLLKADLPAVAEAYQKISPIIFLIAIGCLSLWFYIKRQAFLPQQITAIALVILVFVPTFGPGYSPPYILWYLPLTILMYACSGKAFKKLLVAGFIILALTYSKEYLLFNSHGALLVHWHPGDAEIAAVSEEAGSRGGQTIIRLPMFAWYLVFFGMLIARLRQSLRQTSVAGTA